MREFLDIPEHQLRQALEEMCHSLDIDPAANAEELYGAVAQETVKTTRVIEHSLRKLLASMTVGAQGAVSSPGFDFRFDAHLETVRSHLRRPPSESRGTCRALIWRAAAELKRTNIDQPSYDEFLQALDKEVDALGRRPLNDYTVVFPLDLYGSWIDGQHMIQVQAIQFRKTSWPQLQQMGGWKDFWSKVDAYYAVDGRRDEKNTMLLLTPLTVCARAASWQEAFERAYESFALLRALINLGNDYGRLHEQYGFRKPLGLALPPPVYAIFGADGSYQGFYHTIGRYTYESKPASERVGGFVDQQLARFIGYTESFRDLVIDILLKYGEAMDAMDWRTAYLYLWQILEAATLQRPASMRISDVQRRVANLLEDADIQPLVTALATTRNALVHRGSFAEGGLHDVCLLKIVTELVLSKLLARSKELSTKAALEEYYQHVTLPDSTLLVRRDVIDALLRERVSAGIQSTEDRFVELPYGGGGARFRIGDLVSHIQRSGRDYIIQGQQNCALADHTKPHSLDVWLRENCTERKNTKQAVREVIEALVATDLFEAGRFTCPDSGRQCKGIRFTK